ncbi:MAG TPA: PAS domain-containing protein [Bacteroidales bacterium]|nr:PAS domain-containing protein [Bacteroidales bacterium]HPS50226.1 PAS domain-containing protein [Bacteroidales bacterium]
MENLGIRELLDLAVNLSVEPVPPEDGLNGYFKRIVPALTEKLNCLQVEIGQKDPCPGSGRTEPEVSDGEELLLVDEESDVHYVFQIFPGNFLHLTRRECFGKSEMKAVVGVLKVLKEKCRTLILFEKMQEREAHLKKEQNLLRQIIDNIPDPVYVKDLGGRKILLNKAEAELLNVSSAEEALGKTDEAFYSPEVAAKTHSEDLTVLSSGKPFINVEDTLITLSGKELWFEGNKIPFFDDTGNVQGIIGISHNITDRKNAENQLSHLFRLQKLVSRIAAEFINIPLDTSDEAVNNLLELIGSETMVDRVYIFDYDFQAGLMTNTFEWCAEGINPEIENLRNIPVDDFPDWVNTHRNGKMLVVHDVQKLAAGDPLRMILEPQGIRTLITVPMIVNNTCLGFVGFDSVRKVKPWSNEEISLLQILADLLCNVADRKRTEMELLTREAYLNSIFDNIPYLMWLKDTEGRYLLVNKPFFEYFSLTENDNPVGKTAKDLWPEPISQIMIQQDREVLETRSLKIVEEQMEFHGKKVWFEVFRAPIIDPAGALLGTTGIARDITRKIADAFALQKATEEAQAASVAKTRFLANMSHEIRTPLNAILGMIRLLRDSKLDGAQLKLIDTIRISSSNLLSIINDILDFSKIESGQFNILISDFNLTDLVRKVYDANEYRAEEKGIQLSLKTDQNIPDWVKGDPGRLQQILNNLVSNAIKFTREGSVEIRLELAGSESGRNQVLFKVSDTGIGISRENQEKIFRSFEQEDMSITRTYGGTGLGLAISRQLVELMGGRLELESEKDRGSTFYFTFEMETGSAPAKDADREPAADSAPSLKGLRILLVEDNRFNQFIAQALLEKWGAVTAISDDGSQAVERLQKESYDLILMDIQMPVMDGITAATVIRNELKLNVPILALTANVVKGIIERCEKAGMQGYVSKPFEEAELYARIREVLGPVVTGATENDALAIAAAEPEPLPGDLVLCDVTRLSKMVNNDPVMLGKMIRKFLEVTPEYITDLGGAAARHDMDGISRTSHKIKSAIDLVSGSEMRDLIKAINDAAKTGRKTPEVYGMIDRFCRYFSILTEQLEKQIQS